MMLVFFFFFNRTLSKLFIEIFNHKSVGRKYPDRGTKAVLELLEIGKKKLIAGTGDKLIGNRKWFIDLCTGRYEYVIDVFSLRLTRLSSILIYMESLNDLNNKLQ